MIHQLIVVSAWSVPMRIKYISFLVMFPTLALAQITLSECIRLGLGGNQEFRIAENEASLAREAVKQTTSLLLPALDLAGSYRRQSAVPELHALPIPTAFGEPVNIFPAGTVKLGTRDIFDLQVTLSQPLFHGFRLQNRKRLSEAMAAGKTAEARMTRSRLIYAIETGYADVLKAQQLLRIARTTRAQVGAHLRDVEHLLAHGLVRRDDHLKVQVRYSETDVAVLRAENAVQLARASLEQIIGQKLPPNDSLASMSPGSVPSLSLEEAIARALRNRPEIQASARSVQAGESSRKIAAGARLPSLNAWGSFGYGKPGLDFVKNEWMDYWTVGAGMEWNIWNWGRTRSEVQTAEIQHSSALAASKQVEDAIVLDVTGAFLRLGESEKRVRLMAEIVDQAAESYRVADNSYRQGLSSHSDYFDAQSDFTRVQEEYARAGVDLVLAQANWRRALGINLAE
jgi:outer membrane protein TolC